MDGAEAVVHSGDAPCGLAGRKASGRGVTHEPAARRARSVGLELIQDRCILKEHARRFFSDSI